MTKPLTYLDDSAAAMKLEPKGRPQLIFDAWLNHGPGHDEELSFLVGTSTDNTHDALWLASDMTDQLSALAWLPKETLSGKELFQLLLLAYWQREKEEHGLEDPNFTEIVKNPSAALSPKEVYELAEQVWPLT